MAESMLRTRPDIDIDYLVSVDWWSRVDVGRWDDCWNWKKSTGSHGYGQTWDRITVRLAHRVAWTLHHGTQVPEGMTIDHICHNRRCCNPNHLRVLSNSENASDNGMASRSHCPSGHAYDEPNTYRDPAGHRRCRACAQLRRAA